MAPSIPISASRILWDSSRAQPGDAGIITDFLGGKAGQADPASAIKTFREGLPKMSPKMAESLDPAAVTVWFWATYPYTLGSYASAKPGQYTTMLEVAGEPALDGRLQFAGEHTSSDFLGYHEWRRRKRKPRCHRAHRNHGAAKMTVCSRCGPLSRCEIAAFLWRLEPS